MTFTWKDALGAFLLASAAFGAGALVTHSLGVTAATAAADSASIAHHTRDSLLVVNAGLNAHSDSVARADSAERDAQLGRRKMDSVAVASAKGEAATASTLLQAATTVADSVVLYRDHMVPALRLEVANLTSEIAHADSVGQANANGWHNEIQRSARFTALLLQDSLTLHADSLAIDKLSRVSVVAMSPLAKLETAAETAAIAAATVGACQNKVLSLGCIAGTAVFIKRALKP